jgi:hypothetical protein
LGDLTPADDRRAEADLAAEMAHHVAIGSA